jgi:hypothetical protein
MVSRILKGFISPSQSDIVSVPAWVPHLSRREAICYVAYYIRNASNAAGS